MNTKFKIGFIIFASMFVFTSYCFPQGDINLTLNETSINQAVQALVDSKAVNFAKYDGSYGVSQYNINISSASVNLIGNSSNNIELNLNLTGRATFNCILFSFSVNINSSLTVYGKASLASEGQGYKIVLDPQGIKNYTLTNTFLDALIQDYLNGFIRQLPEISFGTFTTLLPNVVSQYYQSITPTLTITDNAAILSLSLNSITTSGTLASNESWYGTVNLTGNVTIPSGYSLTIQPGTVINFPSGTSLTANGVLSANGNSSSPITFTSTGSTSPGTWGTITFNGSGANGSTLSYAKILYGTEIDVTNANNIIIQNCTITNSSMRGISFSGGTGCSVINDTIKNSNTAHGIVIQNGASVTCTGNVLKKTNLNQQGVGIYFSGGGTGIVSQNDVDGFNWGICANWGSSPTSYNVNYPNKNNRVTNCSVGLDVYYNRALLKTNN